MNNPLDEMFWSASLQEVKRGFADRDNRFVCLVCGLSFDSGEVYPVEGGKWYTAKRMAAYHVEHEHGSMFHYLLNMNKKFTGLTEHQKTMLDLFYEGISDADIVQRTEGGSTSTIRAHRFTLREKEKQAKMFLAIMELLGERQGHKSAFIGIHKTATAIDERFATTIEESEAIISKYFPDGLDGSLSEFPKKEKRKIVLLRHIMNKFTPRKKYTEKEVNEILKGVYADFVTIRRYLIEYGFMSRHDDGSLYWVKE